MHKKKEKPIEKVWLEFKEKENLTNQQVEQFQLYEKLLFEWNQKINLTAITNIAGVVRQHFRDSLILRKFIDLNEINSLADIGAGPGFPAIPLKIIYPHLKVYLIEVNNKKQKFLNAIINNLNLENTEVIDIDWRTFLRKTEINIDIFVTRAALNELELIRMFKPACFYKDSTLIYWASNEWDAHKKAITFIKDRKTYTLGHKERQLIFMKQ